MDRKQISIIFPYEEIIRAITEGVLNEIKKNLIEKPTPSTQFLSRKETASLLGISLVSLNSYSKRSILKSYRIGNRVLYKKSEVEESVTLVRSVKFRKGEIGL